MTHTTFASLSRVLPFWPDELFGPAPLLDRIGILGWEMEKPSSGSISVSGSLYWFDDITLSPPLLGGLGLSLGALGGDDGVDFRATLVPEFDLTVGPVEISLRLDSELFKPVIRDHEGAWVPDPTVEARAVSLRSSLRVDLAGKLGLLYDLEGGITPIDVMIDPFAIGETGVVLAVDSARMILGSSIAPPEAPPGFQGLHVSAASLSLPFSGAPEMAVRDFWIGPRGVTGSVSLERDLDLDLFGVSMSVHHISVELVQNRLTRLELGGELMVPCFDAPLAVTVAIGTDGSLCAACSPEPLTLGDLLTFRAESISLSSEDGMLVTELSGQLTPCVPGVEWPSFEIRSLTLFADGRIDMAGGWLDLPTQATLELCGFEAGVSRLAFGGDGSDNIWIALDAKVALHEALPAACSAEGLKIVWDGTRSHITLEGLAVELEIPDVLRLSGSVSLEQSRFKGTIIVDVVPLSLRVDSRCIIGNGELSVYLGGSFPAGAPLGSTGLGIYGIDGLLAIGRRPSRAPESSWRDWYRAHPLGATDLVEKWEPAPGATGLGAGMAIGTMVDNGHAFSGAFTVLVLLPGPVVILDGRAAILMGRSSLTDNPPFSAYGIIDGRAKEITLGVDAEYRYGDGGELIDLAASAEAFFGAPDRWHIYLGEREPMDRRVRASLFDLFTARGYFMLDTSHLATGAWVGWDKHWQIGPLGIDLEAWIEGNVELSWNPLQYHGDLTLHGGARLSAFGIGLGVWMDATLAADVFEPFHLLASLRASLELPWPLPDLGATITIEWGPHPIPPPVPLLLTEVSIDHLKVSTRWPLPRAASTISIPDVRDWTVPPLMSPYYDLHGDGRRRAEDVDLHFEEEPPRVDAMPVVPLDGRPRLTFSRPIHDDAAVGVNPTPLLPEFECIGNPGAGEGPMDVRYALTGLALYRKDNDAWRLVAGNGSLAAADTPALFGSWAATPRLPSDLSNDDAMSQVKLWLFSKNPFDHTSGTWNEWLGETYADYPCCAVEAPQLLCLDFASMQPCVMESPWRPSEIPGLVLTGCRVAPSAGLTPLIIRDHDEGRALCLGTPPLSSSASRELLMLEFPETTKEVTIDVCSGWGTILWAADTVAVDAIMGPCVLHMSGDPVRQCALLATKELCISSISLKSSQPGAEEAAEAADRISRWGERWAQEEWVFTPNTEWRLSIATEAHARGRNDLSSFDERYRQCEHVYFRTEGPPGLADLSVPVDTACVQDDIRSDSSGSPVLVDDRPVLLSPLDTLSPYVRGDEQSDYETASFERGLPHYRATDVRVRFNESYVELMYRLAKRDLALHLRYQDGEPVRNEVGQRVVPIRGWVTREDAAEIVHETYSEAEESWFAHASGTSCAAVDITSIPADDQLTGEAVVLRPLEQVEGRIQARLLSEDWNDLQDVSWDGPSGESCGYRVEDPPGSAAASSWRLVRDPLGDEIPHLTTSPPVGLMGEEKHGTHLLWTAQEARRWCDLLVRAYLVPDRKGASGILLRYRDRDNNIRVALGEEGWELSRFYEGIFEVLAKVHRELVPDTSLVLTVELIGARITVWADDSVIFDESVDGPSHGTVGFYAWRSRRARFGGLYVDDLNSDHAPLHSVFLNTSRYVDVCHHLGSFARPVKQVEAIASPSWRAKESPDPSRVSGWRSASVPVGDVSTTPTLDEQRALDDITKLACPEWTRQLPGEVRAWRVAVDGQPFAWVFMGPEPFDWRRLSMDAERTSRLAPSPEGGCAVRLLDACWEDNLNVTMLFLETIDVTGWRLDVCPVHTGAEGSWQTVHRFASGAKHEEGSRLTIFGGTPPQAPAGAAHVPASEHVGTISERRSLELRLVGPGEQVFEKMVLHPSLAYRPWDDAGVLRRRDGAGFAVLSRLGMLSVGDVRLRMLWTRIAMDQGLTPLTRAGATEPVDFVLNLPWIS